MNSLSCSDGYNLKVFQQHTPPVCLRGLVSIERKLMYLPLRKLCALSLCTQGERQTCPVVREDECSGLSWPLSPLMGKDEEFCFCLFVFESHPTNGHGVQLLYTLPSKFYTTAEPPVGCQHTYCWKSQPIWPPLKVGPYLNTIPQSTSISSSCPCSFPCSRPFLECQEPGLIPTGLTCRGVRQSLGLLVRHSLAQGWAGT